MAEAAPNGTDVIMKEEPVVPEGTLSASATTPSRPAAEPTAAPTLQPAPATSTPAPTTSTPAPTTSTPAPTISTPAPTISTPAHTSTTPMARGSQTTTPAPPSQPNAHGSPTRVYLNQNVTPHLLEAMKHLAVHEPEKPLKWLSEFLAQKSAEVEGT